MIAPWIRFAGCVLVVAVLYWAQAVFVPVALALLITFVLSPPVTFLQRWIGRVPAVLVVVALVFTIIGLAGWGVATQMSSLAGDLPHYRANIRQKISDVRGAGRGGSVEQVEQTVKDIQTQIASPEAPKGTVRQPLIVQSQQVSTLWDFPSWLGPAIAPLSTAGFVIVLVIFMLLEREDLRGRVIGLVGHGHLAVTTKAFDEAGSRVSRQLLMQTLVNAAYGVAIGAGLWWIGVPYSLLWAALGAALRFIPYLGPIAAAAGPILVSLAALAGWTRPLEVVGLFVVVELFTNLVLETVLYAGAAGVSQVALLVAVAAWTWLWGSMGLLLATPLTVCLVVLGKHFPGLEFLSTLMADSPALSPDVRYYQRLLARDQGEAADIIQRHVASQPPETVYDAVMLPALTYAERDRFEGRLSADEEQAVADETRELLADLETLLRSLPAPEPGEAETDEQPSTAAASSADLSPAVPVEVLAYPANGPSDAIALQMLAQLVDSASIRLNPTSIRPLTSEVIEVVRSRGVRLVCIADLPPSPPSKTRYLVRKLRAALPEVRILIGRWGPESLSDEERASLMDAGANHVATTLIETRNELRNLAVYAG
ncbi:MAG TPA: AI-2E family transporter [Vicinamibacterales bacterium]|jgi:predicted PurR-regulated permease PerM|nr:AI-2E family transporter [Vicinamibacterales bacterium]